MVPMAPACWQRLSTSPNYVVQTSQSTPVQELFLFRRRNVVVLFFWSEQQILQGEIPFLVAAMGLGSLVILYVATNTDDSIRGDPLDLTAATYQLKLILLVAFGILAASLCLLNPTIGLMNAFFVLQSTSTISVDGGAFYFFTDDSSSYPMGPHFSVWFYTTGLGMAASAFGIFGLWIYNRYMSDWTYRGLLIISNLLWSLVSLLSVLEFTRRNRDLLGIPDTAFVLIATVLQSMVSRWAYVPGGLLLCQVCPEGLESTMFALLGGCHNLGRAVASILGTGTYLLAFLGVEPDGTQHDRHCFDRLWMAAVLQALAPLVTLCLIPRMSLGRDLCVQITKAHLCVCLCVCVFNMVVLHSLKTAP
ncbi:unnamed protein product [Effrenium voratum]|nr:unnamed protein product [Effrenium voratum]